MLDIGIKIKNWLRKYLEDANLNAFVIGVSGGIDSALTSTLCAMTGKPTILVSMPIYQSSRELERAENHMKWLSEKYENVENLEFDLSQTYQVFKLMWLN
jgi:NAD+ synthase